MSPEEELASLVSDISEEAYCSGWPQGIEFEIWQRVVEGPAQPIGSARVNPTQLDRLRELSAAIKGWVTFDVGIGPIRIPMDEWLSLYARWLAGESDAALIANIRRRNSRGD